jgi:hypothetical protein
VIAAALPMLAHAQWSPQLDAGIAHHSNFSRAQQAQDRVADTALFAAVAAEHPLPFAPDVAFGLDAKLAQFGHAEGASYAAAGVSGAWRR